MAYLELMPAFKCSHLDSPDIAFSCVEADFCGRTESINFWIDWDNPMSLFNWSQTIGLICRPGWQIGLLGSSMFGGWVLSLLWLPSYSDVYGRKLLFKLSIIVTTLMFFFMWVSKSYLLTLISHTIIGFFTSLRLGVGWPYMLELVHKGSHPVHSVIILGTCAVQQMFCIAFFKYFSHNANVFMAIGFVI